MSKHTYNHKSIKKYETTTTTTTDRSRIKTTRWDLLRITRPKIRLNLLVVLSWGQLKKTGKFFDSVLGRWSRAAYNPKLLKSTWTATLVGISQFLSLSLSLSHLIGSNWMQFWNYFILPPGISTNKRLNWVCAIRNLHKNIYLFLFSFQIIIIIIVIVVIIIILLWLLLLSLEHLEASSFNQRRIGCAIILVVLLLLLLLFCKQNIKTKSNKTCC